MSSATYPLARQPWLMPLLLGTWAAAIAVAPGLPLKLMLALPAVLLPVAFWTLKSPGRWIPCFLATALLLPPLPIVLGDSGPHVCLYFAAIGLLAGALWLPDWRIPHSALNGALAGFFLILLASVAPAAVLSGGAIAAGSLVRIALLGIAVASALWACVDFYFQFPAPAGYGPQFVWLSSGVYRRAQGVFYEASTLGNFCAFFLVMIAVCASRPRAQTPVSRKALAAGGVVFSTALVLSYSRSSLLNVLTALAVLAWLNRKRIRLARLAGILGLIAVTAAILTWQLFPEFLQAYSLRLSTSAQYLTSANGAVFSGRIASWQILADWMAAHPWQTLIGIGYKTLPYTTYLGAPVIGDNMYLSLLVETGVLGLTALMWLNLAILRSAGRASRATDPGVGFCGTWVLCFWAGQTVQMLSGDLLTYWRVLPVYLWVLALAVRA